MFDIVLDSNAMTTYCPCCFEFVQPLTCAFSNCEWKWTGLKGQLTCTQNEQAVSVRSVPLLLLWLLISSVCCCYLLL